MYFADSKGRIVWRRVNNRDVTSVSRHFGITKMSRILENKISSEFKIWKNTDYPKYKETSIG